MCSLSFILGVFRSDASGVGKAVLPGVRWQKGRRAVLPVSILAGPLPGAGCAVAALIRSSVALLRQR